jgi:hypothetical protein
MTQHFAGHSKQVSLEDFKVFERNWLIYWVSKLIN